MSGSSRRRCRREDRECICAIKRERVIQREGIREGVRGCQTKREGVIRGEMGCDKGCDKERVCERTLKGVREIVLAYVSEGI